MSSEAERMARAGEYVLGRMTPAERERAERDLETDDAFRFAVMTAAERMRRFSASRAGQAEDAWSGVARRIEALPHMRGTAPVEAAEPAPPFPQEDDVEGGLSALVRAARARLGGLARALRRRRSRVEAVALLRDGAAGIAAILEVHGDRTLRLLLLAPPAMTGNERLALWGRSGSGAYRRLFPLAGELEVARELREATPCSDFALACERIATLPPSCMETPPFAQGAAQALARPGDARHAERERTPNGVLTLKR